MKAGIPRKALLGLAPLLLAAGCADHADRSSSQYTTIEPRLEQAASREITHFADENKDGKVTRDEAKADPALARSFKKYDLDQNGILDRGEFARLEADAREEPAQFRGHPLDTHAGGESLNRTGERGP